MNVSSDFLKRIEAYRRYYQFANSFGSLILTLKSFGPLNSCILLMQFGSQPMIEVANSLFAFFHISRALISRSAS